MAGKMKIAKWDCYWKLILTGKDLFKRQGKLQSRVRFVECKCVCWNTVRIRLTYLVNWNTKSCWCLMKDNMKKIQLATCLKHWMANTRIYRIYQWIKDRVDNKKHRSYKYYWWSGIKCEWNSFEEFYRDMWESYDDHVKKYWERDTTIDRIDNNWNYCKKNCKWSTWKEQMHNREIVERCWFNYTNKLSSKWWLKTSWKYHDEKTEKGKSKEKRTWNEL